MKEISLKSSFDFHENEIVSYYFTEVLDYKRAVAERTYKNISLHVQISWRRHRIFMALIEQ